MSKFIRWMDNAWYLNYQRNWDDEVFRKKILARLSSPMVILDLGAGAGIVNQMNFRGMVARVCGVDLDSRVESNPYLDEGRVSDAGKIPYSDEYFDLVFADNVFEHLDMPQGVLTEVARVLKPGGLFMFKTPNKLHYMPMIARLTPHVFHQYVNRIRGRAEVDTFPTRYRINTKSDIQRFARATGFDVEEIRLMEGRPEYLRMTAPTYIFGMLYERIVNLTEFFAPFRILLIGTLRKKYSAK
jgi:ubiquinone/menaquinone biosynthesis C-methylase UbiE